MDIGDAVEVQTRFNGAWVSGFEVAERHPDGYRLRRVSDGALLPSLTRPPDLRPQIDPAAVDPASGGS